MKTYKKSGKQIRKARTVVREADERFAPDCYTMKDVEARGQRKAENARQIEEEGDVLWA